MRDTTVRWVSLLCAAAVAALLCTTRSARAEEDWRTEFEAVCSKTDVAMSLSPEELADLVQRCDRIAERLGAEGESVRKIYLRRLKACKDLFAFVLEQKIPGGAAASGVPAGTAPPGAPAAPEAPPAPSPAAPEAPAVPATPTPSAP